MRRTVLEGARIVHPDSVVAQPLAIVDGRVADKATKPYRVDLSDHLVFPGLINAHDHLQLNSVPPLPHTKPFPNSYAWIDVFESHLRDPNVVAATQVSSDARHWHGGLKNLLAGVTTVAHHDPGHGVLRDPDFPVGLVRNFGWSHSLGLGAPRGGLPPRYGPHVSQSFAATSPEHPWIIHLAEGTDDVAASELEQLDSLGCLAPNTVLVHGVGLTSSDVERVIESGAAVVWCPRSNLAMLGRTAPKPTLRKLFAADRLALGSDSRLTGSRDLLGELRVAAAQSDFSPAELVRLVTRNASRVLQLRDRGDLSLGQHADCVIVRSNGDPYDALIHAERSVIRAVVRGGAPMIADSDFAEWFAHCGVAAVQIRLDGQPKLMARQLLRSNAIALEPGLEIM